MAAQEAPRGMAEAMKQAEAGIVLVNDKAQVEVDKPAAEAFKQSHEALLAEKQKVVDSLTGKKHKKTRSAKRTELSALEVDKQYIDACKDVASTATGDVFSEPQVAEALAAVDAGGLLVGVSWAEAALYVVGVLPRSYR